MVLYGTLPSMNDIIQQSKKHFGSYSTVKKKYTELVAFTAISQKIKKYNKVNIRIVWYCKNKRRDKDNVSAGIKYILDGLVQAKIIKDDAWDYVDSLCHQFAVDSKKPRIVVYLEETKK